MSKLDGSLGISRRSVVVLATLDNSINAQSVIVQRARCAVLSSSSGLLGFLKLLSGRLPKNEGQKGTHSGLGSTARQRTEPTYLST